MTERTSHDVRTGRGTSPPVRTPSAPVGPGHVPDSLMFCLGDGAGGFGGVYWLDDRPDRPDRDTTHEGSAAPQVTPT